MKARHGPPGVGTMMWTSRPALGAGGRDGTDGYFINQMKSRSEQDHDEYPPFALILSRLPRGAAYAPLP